jgi:hypothetical protein
MTAKITVRDRDLSKASDSGNLDHAEDVDRLKKFAEAQLLRFATEYFATRTPAPPVHTAN